MNQLDKKLYNDLSCKTEIPSELDTVIKKGLCKKKSNVLNFKRIASFLIIIFATSGIVFAGSAMYDKNIWKEPERVVVESAKDSTNQNEFRQNTMSEDEARKKASEILEKFEYKDENGKIQFIEANTVLSAVGLRPKTEEAYSFYGHATQTYMIGNCEKVGLVLHATNDAYFIAKNI